MEKLKQQCSICGVVHKGDFYELRKYFTTSKRAKSGLDSRCKKCKKEISKKYRVKIDSDKYKAIKEKKSLFSKYASKQVDRLTTEEIINGIEALEKRLIELREEKVKRLG